MHNKFNFGERLYCNGVVPCIPETIDELVHSPIVSLDHINEMMTGEQYLGLSMPQEQLSSCQS